MHLSVEDRLDILELPARYADALDLLQPERLVDVFTDDAVWEVVGGGLRLEGMAAIQEFMGRDDVHPGAHLMTNVYITDVVDGVAHLSSRGVYPTEQTDRRTDMEVFYGRYADEVVRTDVGWRIRHRRFWFGSRPAA